MSPLVKYSLIRVGLFVIVLAVLIVVGVPGWLAAIAAALVALSVAYIFFRQQRDEAIAVLSKKPDAPTAASSGAVSDEQAEDR